MRGEQRVGGGQQRRVGRWLGLEDVETGAGQVTARERRCDGRFVDDPTAGHIQHDRARLEPRDLLLADDPPGRPRQRDVHGHDIRPLEEGRHVDELDAMVRRLLLGQVGVAAEHDHLHRPRPDRDRLADLAETDDPERSPAQFQSGELAALPFAAAQARVGCRGPTRDAVQERERVLGCGDRVARRGVDDRDPGARRSVKVDVVDADPRPADDDEAGACRDELGVHLDLAAHDQRVVVGQDRPELLASTADALVDLVVRGEEIDALARDALGDEDPHAVVPATDMLTMPLDASAAR